MWSSFPFPEILKRWQKCLVKCWQCCIIFEVKQNPGQQQREKKTLKLTEDWSWREVQKTSTPNLLEKNKWIRAIFISIIEKKLTFPRMSCLLKLESKCHCNIRISSKMTLRVLLMTWQNNLPHQVQPCFNVPKDHMAMQENRALCMNYSANRSRRAVRFQCSWKHSVSDRPLKAHDEYKSFFFILWNYSAHVESRASLINHYQTACSWVISDLWYWGSQEQIKTFL